MTCLFYFLMRRQKAVHSEGERDYPELIECTGFLQRHPESYRRIKVRCKDMSKGATPVFNATASRGAVAALTLRSKLERLTVSSSFSLRFLF